MYTAQELKALCEAGDVAGREAVANTRVTPMIVGQETYFGSGKLIPETMEYVESGVCGFAWVSVTPAHKGTTRIGKQERAALEANGFSKDVYGKRYMRSISDYNQSMQKKEAHARAFAKVLSDAGIYAYAQSRID